MAQNNQDWKDVVATYYDKCLSLTILFVMFAFIVFPNVETQMIAVTERVIDAIDIMHEIIEQIRPPEEVARPIVNIEIVDDDFGADADDDIIFIDTIGVTSLDVWQPIMQPSVEDPTPRWVPFEEAPVILRRVPPVYPESLRRLRMQGTVILEAEILTDGSIREIEVYRSLMAGEGGFDEAAIQALRQWQFQPARSGGRPVACWIRIPIVFELSN